MVRKSKVEMSFDETCRKIVSEECSLFNKSMKRLLFKKNGQAKQKDGKFEYEVIKNCCEFGHICKYFENLPCHAFNEDCVKEYIGMRKVIQDKKDRK